MFQTWPQPYSTQDNEDAVRKPHFSDRFLHRSKQVTNKQQKQCVLLIQIRLDKTWANCRNFTVSRVSNFRWSKASWIWPQAIPWGAAKMHSHRFHSSASSRIRSVASLGGSAPESAASTGTWELCNPSASVGSSSKPSTWDCVSWLSAKKFCDRSSTAAVLGLLMLAASRLFSSRRAGRHTTVSDIEIYLRKLKNKQN